MAGKVFEIAFAINGALAQSFKTSMQQARGTLTQYGSQMTELKVQQRALDSALKQGVIPWIHTVMQPQESGRS